MWKTNSISFAIVVLFLGTFLGSVMGSLLSQIFGLDFLNYTLFAVHMEDLYLLQKITIAPTTSAVLGLLVTAWFLYRQWQITD